MLPAAQEAPRKELRYYSRAADKSAEIREREGRDKIFGGMTPEKPVYGARTESL